MALVGFIGFRVYQAQARAGKAKVAPATVILLKVAELVAVQPSAFEQTLPLSGALDPYTQAVVGARASGEIQTVNVREGQSVKKGQVLAALVSTTYQAQYQQAVSNVASAKSALDLAQKDYNNNAALVKEGFISQMALQKLTWLWPMPARNCASQKRRKSLPAAPWARRPSSHLCQV